jgi:deoxyribodipyrimidine photolyase-like uncharacterized protein
MIDHDEFKKQFEKPPIMETFYRYMRRSRHILIEDDGKPVGGKWNYDSENRNFDKTHTSSWSWEPRDTQHVCEACKYYSVSEV